MLSIFRKEIKVFFSSLIGYVVIGVFLLIMGLMMFVFPDYSLLNYNYATLDQLFDIAPMIFMFLIPAVTMRSFAEENQTGTIELLVTKPIKEFEIILGKFLANFVLVVIALLPTLIYYYTVYQLGSPKGNLDSGAVVGSYIGLLFLGASFTAIGIFASSVSNNQIVAFILAVFCCFFVYWSFDFLSKIPYFVGSIDDLIQKIGIEEHYRSISRGVIDSRDVIYFLSLILLFLTFTLTALEKRKW